MSKKYKSSWVLYGALLGALGVAMGAFGAHALRDSLTDHYLQVYETASKYMLLHAVLITSLGVSGKDDIPRASLWSLCVGVCIFSISLWVLAITQIKWLGAITPIGGVLLIIGWLRLAWWGRNGGS